MNVVCRLVVLFGLLPIFSGCRSQHAISHSPTDAMTAREKAVVTREIQALNDKWGRFCVSVVATKDYSRIAAGMEEKFTPDFVGVGFDGKLEKGLDRAIEGTTRFLAGLHRLIKTQIKVDQVEWQSDGTVSVVTTFDWSWEALNKKTGRLHRIDDKGREKATYLRTSTGWKISRSEILVEKFYTDGKLDTVQSIGQ